MHLPDGFLDAPTCVATGVVAAGAVGVALRRTGRTLDDRRIPLAGTVAAFVFAAQMVNVPVGAGTSGHLMGGALAAVLVGPALAVVCTAVVLVVQALLFADGGITTMGANVLNLAVVGALGGWVIHRGLVAVLPRRPGSVVVASGIAAGASVVLAALAFSAEYAMGGAGGASPGAVVGAMVGVHLLIGVVEGVITALTVGTVVASRPDLVAGLPALTPTPSGATT